MFVSCSLKIQEVYYMLTPTQEFLPSVKMFKASIAVMLL